MVRANALMDANEQLRVDKFNLFTLTVMTRRFFAMGLMTLVYDTGAHSNALVERVTLKHTLGQVRR